MEKVLLLNFFHDLPWPCSPHSLVPCLHQYKTTSLFDPFKTEHRCCNVTAVICMYIYVAIYSSGTKLMEL